MKSFSSLMRTFVLLACLSMGLPAHADFTLVGGAFSPADNGTQDSSVARATTPVGSMVTGDLIFYDGASNEVAGTYSVPTTGGQTWTSLGAFGTRARGFWAIYNGTWAADPTIDQSTHGTLALSTYMVVFRPTSGSCTITQDVAQSGGTFTAPASLFDVTVTGQTPTAGASVVSIAYWMSTDDNSWTLQTGGWTNPSGVTQSRNLTGVDLSMSIAYLIQGSAAATGDVTNRQTVNGGDAGAAGMITFIESCATAPTFSSGPTATSGAFNTTTGTFTSSTSATIYGVTCPQGQTAPTVPEAKAATCTGGASPTASANKAVTGADTLLLTQSAPLLYVSDHFVLSNGAGDSSLATVANITMAAASGYVTPAALGTICTASPCPVFNYNATVGTDIIAGDFFSCKATTEPDALDITWGTDGAFTYQPTSARQLLHCKYQDLSAFGMFAGANTADFYVNNGIPAASPSSISQVWYIGDVVSQDYETLFTDPEDDVLTCVQDSTGTGAGTNLRPAGTTFTGVALGGTVTTAQAGDYTITCTDIAGDAGALEVSWEVRALPVSPACTTGPLTFVACTELAQTAFIDWDISGTVCATPSVPSGSIFSQSPTAGTTMTSGQVLNLVVARGCGNGGRLNLNLRLGL